MAISVSGDREGVISTETAILDQRTEQDERDAFIFQEKGRKTPKVIRRSFGLTSTPQAPP